MTTKLKKWVREDLFPGRATFVKMHKNFPKIYPLFVQNDENAIFQNYFQKPIAICFMLWYNLDVVDKRAVRQDTTQVAERAEDRPHKKFLHTERNLQQ